ncbi:MAG: flavin reductase family protein [Candidatus Latescibacterota bacterium]
MKQMDPGASWSRIRPEWTALAVSWDAPNNRPDIITLGWTMHTSGRPSMAAIAIGHSRYSHELIAKEREFVLVYPNARMGKAAMYCGSHSGRKVDKFEQTDLVPLPSRIVKPPLIQGAVVNMECQVSGTLVAGDHTIFVGEIVTAYEEPEETEILLNFGGPAGSNERVLTGITEYARGV